MRSRCGMGGSPRTTCVCEWRRVGCEGKKKAPPEAAEVPGPLVRGAGGAQLPSGAAAAPGWTAGGRHRPRRAEGWPQLGQKSVGGKHFICVLYIRPTTSACVVLPVGLCGGDMQFGGLRRRGGASWTKNRRRPPAGSTAWVDRWMVGGWVGGRVVGGWVYLVSQRVGAATQKSVQTGAQLEVRTAEQKAPPGCQHDTRRMTPPTFSVCSSPLSSLNVAA